MNIFQKLLVDARTGDRLHVNTQNSYRVLAPQGVRQRGDACVSFPLAVFERAVLSALAELDPAELLRPDATPDDLAEREADATRLAAQLRALLDLFDADSTPARGR